MVGIFAFGLTTDVVAASAIFNCDVIVTLADFLIAAAVCADC